MATIAPAPSAPTAGTRLVTYAPPGPPPPDTPPPSGNANTSPRVRFAHWMENTFGRAYMPITMIAGGAIGGTLGMLTLGPVGGIAGAAAGAMFFGALIFSD